MTLDTPEAATPPHPRTLEQLESLVLDPARPLLAVDADEVLVDFAGHLSRWLVAQGIAMELVTYELEGSMRRADTGEVLAFADCIGMIQRYFAAETLNQILLPGACAALERLSARAQILVLTNVPQAARADRITNLAAQGIRAPLVENSGGKGPALAWLAARVAGPVVFIDDSPSQLASAHAHAPQVHRVQFAGAPHVAQVLPKSPHARRVADWAEAEALILHYLDKG